MHASPFLHLGGVSMLKQLWGQLVCQLWGQLVCQHAIGVGHIYSHTPHTKISLVHGQGTCSLG